MKKILLLILICLPLINYGQIDVNNLLQLTVGSTVEMNAVNPSIGTIMYNTDDNQVYEYNGSNWNRIDSQDLTFDAAAKTLTISNGNTIDLSSLVDDQDWVISGNDIYNSNSGNVGIGTPTPSEKLDVVGNIHSSNAITIGTTPTSSRLSITDHGYTGSMFDIETDDSGPWAFRLLNKTYSNNYSNAFRFYQSNNGQVNISVGGLSHSFLTIYHNPNTNLGGIGIGGSPDPASLFYIARGTKNVGSKNYRLQRFYFNRQGALDDTKSTQGIYNVLYGGTTGTDSRYYGQQNTVGILSGDFKLAYGDYAYVYNSSSNNNSSTGNLYGNSAIAYERSDGGAHTVRGIFARASKNLGTGNVISLIGADNSAIRTDSNFGDVDNEYGNLIQVYGAKNSQFGISITSRVLNANTANVYGSYARLYSTAPWIPQNMYGYYVNSSASTSDASNAIFNMRVHSTGHTTLPQNFGNHILLRGGIDNYGFYADVQNGSGNNYAIYANAGISFFRDSIGIGTASPTEALDINGNVKIRSLVAGASIDNVVVTDGNGVLKSVPQSSIGATSEPWYQVGTTAGATSNNDDVFINGKVAIGKNNPTEQFEVSGAAIIGNTNFDSDLDGQGHFQSISNLNNHGFIATPWVYARVIEGDQRGSSSTLVSIGKGSTFTNSDQIAMVTNGSSRIFVDTDGEIGIGTTTPEGKLDVDGTLLEGSHQSMFGNSPTIGTGQISHGVASFFSTTSNANYIHIKLPYTIDSDNKMYHIKVTGYNYGGGANSHVIDLTYVGYCYANGNQLRNKQIINSGGTGFSTTQYVGSDNYIYLRLKTTSGNNYYMTLRTDSMFVGNGRVIKSGEIEIISSPNATL